MIKNSLPLPPPFIVNSKLAQHLAFKLPGMIKRLPKPPFPLQKAMTEKLLHHLLSESIEMGEWDFLQEKWLQLNINDVGLSFFLTFHNDSLLLSNQITQADVIFSGDAREFILLASRHEDPDTLFFQRRLIIEGDTELGLYIKNAIDGIDFEYWPTWLNRTVAIIATLLANNGNSQPPPGHRL